MKFLLIICLLCLLFSLYNCFKLNNRLVNSYNSYSNKNIVNNDIGTKRLIKTSLNDQSAFVAPLAISIFTMVPFLLYQQALKPKPRTVKQIELDAQLKPKDKKVNAGKTGTAQAQGKKK